ncbi:MAG: heme anaerobic degradation radical SAM methyltransferase ChuW/HutW [Alphaproteobacteria bacterium]|uniref:Heme anaerobic degradation radical SAM methyltransferase ChuW/HutW n=1 Tax=Candidatus Nitrobium versatile TaxID=2884831 RepID=A0A953M2P8_9BACT|nr:heme anaerobic degradation radical SAM methyltransferase ChuW/HutW [Candidatus Nitrobium versatile]
MEMAKSDRFIKSMTECDPADRKWIFGNETDDPLRYAFDAKRVVHPGVKGEMLPKEKWESTWKMLTGKPGKGGKRAAYVHIPFCSAKCLYCGFFQNLTDRELEDAYIDRLVEELRRDSQEPFVASHPFHAVYLGGGTPSSLSERNIERLLRAINEFLPLANDCEFTFEARIHHFNDAKVQACIGGGINRFSLGVQSFNTRVRQSLGRREPGEKVIERLHAIHRHDQAAVVIDLMYGLPLQSMEVWEEDVRTLIRCGIDGGDLYQLNVYNDSKLNDAISRGSLPPAAKTAEQALMFRRGLELMQESRLRRLSICHWSSGTRERNLYNSLSKSGSATVPFGSGAGGKIDGYTMFVDKDIKSYLQRIDKREKPLMFVMSPREGYALYNDIIAQLERGHLNLLWMKAGYGTDVEETFSPLFGEWARKGLVEMNGDYMDLTVAGQFWYVNLTQAILDGLVLLREGGKHSLTVRSIAAQG